VVPVRRIDVASLQTITILHIRGYCTLWGRYPAMDRVRRVFGSLCAHWKDSARQYGGVWFYNHLCFVQHEPFAAGQSRPLRSTP